MWSVDLKTVPICIGGEPLGYLNYDMIEQIGWQGIESVFLYGGTCLAMDFAFAKGFISKFK